MNANQRLHRPGLAAAPVSFALSLVACGLFFGVGCGRETLIGIDITPVGSGGIYGGGSGGRFGGGSGGNAVPACSGGSAGGGLDAGTGSDCSIVSFAPGTLNGCGPMTGAAFSPDGSLLAVSSQQQPTLRVWRVSDGALLYQVRTDGSAYNVTFSPDGTLLALGGLNSTQGGSAGINAAAVFDARTGRIVATLPSRSGDYLSAVAFSHDGARLVTAGEKSFIQEWRVADWSELLAIPAVESIYAVDFSADDSRFLTSGSSGTNRILRTSDGVELAEIPNGYPEMNRATYSPNGELILDVGSPGKLRILDANVTLLQTVDFGAASDAVNPIGHAVWIDDDRFLADDWSGNVEEWSRDPAQAAAPFTLAHTWTMAGQAWGIAVAPDGHTFVVTGEFGFVVLAP
jgi:hypothetical protein